jgi:hypothetical protein
LQEWARLGPAVNLAAGAQLARAAPALVLARFMALRVGLPAEEMPKYHKGEHLKGPDDTYMRRAMAELVGPRSVGGWGGG